jgi:hypothetical protein
MTPNDSLERTREATGDMGKMRTIAEIYRDVVHAC